MSEEIKPIKLKFSDLGTFEFGSMIQKIASKETSNRNACTINRVIKELKKMQTRISETYKTDIVEKFGTRNDAGEIVRPEGEPAGFIPKEGSEAELEEALKVFGETEHEINAKPLTPLTLADHRLSARDIELLKDLFVDEEPNLGAQGSTCPSVPGYQNVGPGVPR